MSVMNTAPAQGAPTREAIATVARTLHAVECDSPRLDAELLVAHALGVRRERLFSDPELTLSSAAQRALAEALRRRALEHEPLAYITGRRAFRHLELAVDSRALIPRPETELLVEAALSLPARARVLDVGTGCGAVALALADERPDLDVHGSDVSADALALAADNGRALALEVGWLHADLLTGLGDDFDAVLANLPYVAEHERDALAPEISRHEPALALLAGSDGLEAIRALLAQLAWRSTCKLVALEVGVGQALAVAAMVRDCGFERVRVRRDLAGIERVVTGEGRRT